MTEGRKEEEVEEEEVEEEEKRRITVYIVYIHISIDRWITLDILSHPDNALIKIKKRKN